MQHAEKGDDPQSKLAWQVADDAQNLVELGNREDKTWTFDKVFAEHSKNQDVFNNTVADLIPRVIEGYHGTALVYGQTSSGKTYTMFGGPQPETESGAVQLGLEKLFQAIEDQKKHREFVVELSYVEVYNEVIGDLLTPVEDTEFKTPTKRQAATSRAFNFLTPQPRPSSRAAQAGAVSVRDDQKGGVTLSAARKPATSATEAMDILRQGERMRHVSATGMNERSSRAHTILMVHVSSVSLEDHTKLSAQLNFVDLAGSESMRTSNAKGSQIAEAKNINQSLLALALAMASLAEGGGHTRHVSFRTSKLTRILKPALCGDSLVCVICCITPVLQFKEESKRTLHFARTAARVPIQASKHQCQAPEVTIEQLKRKVALLRAQSAPSMESQERDNQERDKERRRFRKLLLLAQQHDPTPKSENLPLYLVSPVHTSNSPSTNNSSHFTFPDTKLLEKPVQTQASAGSKTPSPIEQRKKVGRKTLCWPLFSSPQQKQSFSDFSIEQIYVQHLRQQVQSLKDDLGLKSSELQDALKELSSTTTKHENLTTKLEISQKQFEDITAQFKQSQLETEAKHRCLAQELANAQVQNEALLAERDKTSSETQAKLLALREEKEAIEGQCNLLRSDLEESIRLNDSRQTEIDQLYIKLGNQQMQASAKESALQDELCEQERKLEASLSAKLVVDQERTNLEKELEESRMKIKATETDFADLQIQLKQTHVDTFQREQDLLGQIAELTQLVKRMEESEQTLQMCNEELEHKLSIAQNDCDSARSNASNNEAQLKDLQLKANNCERKLRSELDFCKGQLQDASCENDSLGMQCEALQIRLEDAETKQRDLARSHKSLHLSLEKAKTTLETKEAEFLTQLKAQQKRLEEAQIDKQVLAQKFEASSKQCSSLIAANENAHEDLAKVLYSASSRDQDFVRTIIQYEDQVHEARVTKRKYASRLELLGEEISVWKARCSATEAEANHYRLELEHLQDDAAKHAQNLKSELARAKNDIEDLQDIQNAAEADIQTLRTSLAQSNTKLDRLQTEKENAEKDCQRLEERIRDDEEKEEKEERSALAAICQEKSDVEAARSAVVYERKHLEVLSRKLQNENSALEANRRTLVRRDHEIARREDQLVQAQMKLEKRVWIVTDKERKLKEREAHVHKMATDIQERQAQLQSTVQILRSREEEVSAREDDLEVREAEVQIYLQHLDNRGMPKSRVRALSKSSSSSGFSGMTPISQYASYVSAVAEPISFQSSLLDAESSKIVRRSSRLSSIFQRQDHKLEALERELGVKSAAASLIVAPDQVFSLDPRDQEDAYEEDNEEDAPPEYLSMVDIANNKVH